MRQRVLQAAEELNYHPNAFARHLKTQKTQTIGVFISRFGGSFYEEILEGIHDAAMTAGYELIVSPNSPGKRRLLTDRQVDGAIVFDTKVDTDLLVRLASKGFPIVVMDRLLSGDFIFPVLIDNARGVREAFCHLYDQGARRIAFVAGALDAFDNAERMGTFLQEAAARGLQVPCYHGDFTEASGYAAALQIVDAAAGHADLPEAVFCANDQMALGFLRAMKERGLRAPDDIALVGFDDIVLAHYVQPGLSTIGASRFEWGARAASVLFRFLENGAPPELARMPVRFVARESSTMRR
jgi:LacI family transcriptional regulator